ncbi:sialate O-acetylesterase [Glaciecola petra]|uniref:Sialate O-acetylesterase n=1 Tax=Glaciecola petra TaxID=3075602 RepID=A0ABU2ZQN9_9ALTE|nr:sialate O-acetylesterase [Aestuariibacter sp. P117]MDT0593914.1 sialate O-acetylesterase [Aestuariibacter sp. P117]
MKKLFIGLLLYSFSNFVFSDEYLTFFLAGQSNMVGYGYVNELPAELRQEQSVMIFHGNGTFDNQPDGGTGLWSKLKPGHGTGFKSDGKTNHYANRFGAELSFASTLTKHFPDKKIAIVKYAVGGTGLHLNTGYGNWSPDFREGDGKNQYDFALNTIERAFSSTDIDGDGEIDTLIPAGIIWMQGEADAHQSEASANAYFNNLTRLMELFRAALRKDDIPIVIGKITNSGLSDDNIMPYIKRVQLAQQQFVEHDICAGYMTKTEGYPYSKNDPWHYLSDGFVQMGENFANAFVNLESQCKDTNVESGKS